MNHQRKNLIDKPAVKIGIVLGIIGILALMFLITILTIKTPMPILQNPESPYGYTLSNLHWILPTLSIFGLMAFLRQGPGNREAFLWTITVMPTIGFVLDIVFADRFFTFRNSGAVHGWSVSGFSFETLSFSAPIPIEEFVFYVSGHLYTLTAYVFAKDVWLSKYNSEMNRPASTGPYPIVAVACAGLGLIALGFGLKAAFGIPGSSPIPEYYLFIVVFGSMPFIALLPIVKRAVNWQALSWALLSVLLISVIWEVTLAVPYSWWGYRKEVMVGVFIKPWFDLPLEAVAVWLTVTFATVAVYEAIALLVSKRGTLPQDRRV